MSSRVVQVTRRHLISKTKQTNIKVKIKPRIFLTFHDSGVFNSGDKDVCELQRFLRYALVWVGGWDRFYICAIAHVAGVDITFSSMSFWVWALVGLCLPETTREPKGLQSHSRPFWLCPFPDSTLEHGTFLFGSNSSPWRVKSITV